MASADADNTPQESPSRTRGLMPPWQPGQSGNPAGRPKSARNKLSEDFFKALQADFEEHGVAAIIAMRLERPGDYAKMVAALQTKETDNKHEGDLNISEVGWLIRGKPQP